MQTAQRLSTKLVTLPTCITDSLNFKSCRYCSKLHRLSKRNLVKKWLKCESTKLKQKCTKRVTKQFVQQILRERSGGHGTTSRKKLNLIWRRTIASQMVDAQILRTKITAGVEDKSVPEFRSQWLTSYFAWLASRPRSSKRRHYFTKVCCGRTI